MKDWDTIKPDVTRLLTTHYTPGRAGRSIDKIVLHHNAGDLDVDGCWRTWQTREASAHYQVCSSGLIGRLVSDSDTAWHAGNLEANRTSIGIEHADISSDPWLISDSALDNGAHLVAALCRHYQLGRPQWGVNVFPHSAFSATSCPASIAGTQQAAYMRTAQNYYDDWNGDDMSQADVNIIKDKVLKNNNALGRMEARPTHIVFQYGTALGIANIMAGTYELFGDAHTWQMRKMILDRTGYVLKEWREFTTNKTSNIIKDEDLAGFGVRIGGNK